MDIYRDKYPPYKSPSLHCKVYTCFSIPYFKWIATPKSNVIFWHADKRPHEITAASLRGKSNCYPKFNQCVQKTHFYTDCRVTRYHLYFLADIVFQLQKIAIGGFQETFLNVLKRTNLCTKNWRRFDKEHLIHKRIAG